jgi:hypothetical protein
MRGESVKMVSFESADASSVLLLQAVTNEVIASITNNFFIAFIF